MIELSYKKILSILAGNSFVVASNFIIASLLVTNAGLINYGYFITVQSILISTSIFFKPTTWVSVIKYRDNSSLLNLAITSVFIELIFALKGFLLIFILSFFIENKFFEFIFDNIVIIFFYILIVNSGVFLGVLRSLEKYKIISFVLSGCALLKIFLAMMFYSNVDTLLLYIIISDSVVWFFASCYALFISKNNFDNLKGSVVDRVQFLKTSLISSFNQILDLPLTQLDRVIVAFIAGSETAAIFNLIRRLSALFNQLGDPLYQVYLRQFSADNFRLKGFHFLPAIKYSLVRIGAPIIIAFLIYPFIINYIDVFMFDSSLQGYYLLLFLFLNVSAVSILFIWVNPLYFLHVSQYKTILVTFLSNAAYVASLFVVFVFLDIYYSFMCIFIQLLINYAVKYYDLCKAKACSS
jgi:O-antigen/teichoic acid export membrane protein